MFIKNFDDDDFFYTGQDDKAVCYYCEGGLLSGEGGLLQDC